MINKNRELFVQAFGSATISILCAMLLWHGDILTDWENRVWDIQTRFFASPSLQTDNITIVLVDQKSLEWVQENMGISWPWPRELYGAVISNITRNHGLGVGFDVLFTEASSYGVSDDDALGTAIAANKHFAAGSVFPGKIHGKHSTWPDNVPLPPFAISANIHQREIFPSYEKITMPIAEVAQNASILSNVHHDPDRDGIYRSLHPLVFADGAPLPALGLGVYLATHPEAAISLLDNTLTIDACDIPINKYGKLMLRFRGPPGTYNRISAATLIQDEMRYREDANKTQSVNQQLKDKYVLFGFSAHGLFDLRPTPVGAIFSGVEIHATLLDNLLSNDFIIPVNRNLQSIFLILSTLLLGYLSTRFSRPAHMTLLAILFVFLPLLLTFTFFSRGYYLELLPFEIAIGGTILLSFMFNYMREGKQRRFIKHSFSHYLSPQVIEQLIQDPDRLQLGGDRKELTIFFSDLEGFTSISENLAPDQLIQLLNDYLSAMTEIILDEEGTIDKYEGDAIIAFWNAPLETPGHPARAVSAALRCQKRLAELRPLFQKRCGHEMHMRIGINTGQAVVGNLGSSNRFDYSMLGDAVNLAARLEGANKQFDSYTMISDATHTQLDTSFLCRELALLTVVGRKTPVRVYEPYFHDDFLQKKETLQIFANGLKAFYDGNFDMAMIAFKKITQCDPSALKYLDKSRALSKDPPEEWKGVWSLTSK